MNSAAGRRQAVASWVCARTTLPLGTGDRVGKHGHGLRRARSRARPADRAQDHQPQPHRGSDDGRPLPARGADRLRASAPQHRRGVRRRARSTATGSWRWSCSRGRTSPTRSRRGRRTSPTRRSRSCGGSSTPLEVAHAHQIVHRDIKPQNIFLARSDGGAPGVKVLDFGVAKVVGLSAEEQLTRSGTILGTPEFMAPGAGDRPRRRPPQRSLRGRLRRLRDAVRAAAVPRQLAPARRHEAGVRAAGAAVAAAPGAGARAAASTASWPGRWRRSPRTATSRRRRCARRSKRWPADAA